MGFVHRHLLFLLHRKVLYHPNPQALLLMHQILLQKVQPKIYFPRHLLCIVDVQL
jgi:hypothetical protein